MQGFQSQPVGASVRVRPCTNGFSGYKCERRVVYAIQTRRDGWDLYRLIHACIALTKIFPHRGFA